MNTRITPDTCSAAKQRARERLEGLVLTEWAARIVALLVTSTFFTFLLLPLGPLFRMAMMETGDEFGALPIFAAICAAIIIFLSSSVICCAIFRGRHIFDQNNFTSKNETPLEREASRALLLAWEELCRSDPKFTGINCFVVDFTGTPNACIQKMENGAYHVFIDRRILKEFSLNAAIGILAHELGHRKISPLHEGWWYHFFELCDDIIFFIPSGISFFVMMCAERIAGDFRELHTLFVRPAREQNSLPQKEGLLPVVGRYGRSLLYALSALPVFMITLPTWFRMWQIDEYRADIHALFLAKDASGMLEFLNEGPHQEAFIHANFFRSHPSYRKRARMIGGIAGN